MLDQDRRAGQPVEGRIVAKRARLQEFADPCLCRFHVVEGRRLEPHPGILRIARGRTGQNHRVGEGSGRTEAPAGSEEPA